MFLGIEIGRRGDRLFCVEISDSVATATEIGEVGGEWLLLSGRRGDQMCGDWDSFALCNGRRGDHSFGSVILDLVAVATSPS